MKEVVITAAVRTPVGAFCGALKRGASRETGRDSAQRRCRAREY